jgi:SAM-dependent methyltransferase
MLEKILSRLHWHLGMRLAAFSDKSAIEEALAIKRATNKPVLVNLGCGAQIHPDWINIDFRGDGKSVFSWDLRRRLPLADRSCDAVYASHVIEHFDRGSARHFLLECQRVLKDDGCIRLVAPDLEGITRAYLHALEAARSGEADGAARYDWMILELLDQLVRHQSGGEMMRYWSKSSVPAEDFVAQRVGGEYWRARKFCISLPPSQPKVGASSVGKFRLAGEPHLWMYDSYSLGCLLSECGFVAMQQCAPTQSAIAGFNKFGLDVEPNGAIYKPDSFFIEARVS